MGPASFLGASVSMTHCDVTGGVFVRAAELLWETAAAVAAVAGGGGDGGDSAGEDTESCTGADGPAPSTGSSHSMQVLLRDGGDGAR